MVPTPFDCKLGKVDDSAILESLLKLSQKNYEGIIIIKSTIPPGFCNHYCESFNLKIVFNPEFLRESTTPNEDFENQDTIVIGCKDEETFKKVKEMYEMVAIPEALYHHCSHIEAEMIKSAQNTILASRVALANVIFDACELHGVDYNNFKKIAFDRFEIIGPHMSLVPGPDGKRGFGGKCLPKDIRAFSTTFNSEIISSIIKYNDSIRDDLDLFLENFKSKKIHLEDQDKL